MFHITLFKILFEEPLSSTLFSELVLLWSLSNYLIGRDPVPEISAQGAVTRIHLRDHRLWIVLLTFKAIVMATLAGGMCAWGSWLLPVFVFSTMVALPLLRAKIAPSRIAELEIGANLIFVAALAELIGHSGLKLGWVLFTVEMSSARIAASSLIVAILIFSLRGGTYIVRSILDKAGTLPPLKEKSVEPSPSDSSPVNPLPVSPTVPTQPSQITNNNLSTTATLNALDVAPTVDLVEYSRGRLIGNLERLLLVAIVVAGSYQSLAFLAAAKGLIRSKNLENRAWAEYFLVGSLASAVVSVVAGLLIGQLLKHW